ncbi:MAG: molybdopterin-dependent oxidoreductase [Candidatus Delongbacteria bacterium]|nr:molybdopterin-dependent oxidoreductase [Candidatus Delongbacteria bacterium]
MKHIGKKTARVDGLALMRGKPVFADDIRLKDCLHLKILRSPHAHARITSIDASAALELPGVLRVLSWQDVRTHYYTTAGQGYPEPSPRDLLLLDQTMRFVGDKVALVVAESLEAAERALHHIHVDYEILPAIFDPEAAIDNPVVLHPEEGKSGIHDPARNIASEIFAEVGDVDAVLAGSAHVYSGRYSTPYVQQVSIEPHISLSWLDENERVVIRTATQVPFHVRRIVAEVLDLPVSRIRVIKPRIGGGFGGKQEILGEELVAWATLITGRPARLELTREEELYAARSRHPQIVDLTIGLDDQRRITAIDLKILENCGAYGPHALTVMSVTAQKTLTLYRSPAIRVHGQAVYTNLPVAGAYRGYGAPQGFFALESLMDEIAIALEVDPIELRRRNVVRVGDDVPIAKILGEGREGFPVVIQSSGMDECLDRGKLAIDWDRQRVEGKQGHLRTGVGMAAVAQGSGIPGIDMGAAWLKMNEDGSFNLQVGATDLGTGSDTALAQIAAEVLEVSMDKVLVYSSDTDLTPFDTGAYASSTTYISGGAVKKAAEAVREQILSQGRKLLKDPQATIGGGEVLSRDGRRMGYPEICTRSFYTDEQMQIQACASHMSYDSPPPFNATFATVSVDTRTGIVRVLKVVSITDAGQVINPQMAEGQVEGAIPQSLGMALSEYMIFDELGRPINRTLRDYSIYTSLDMPEIVAEFVPGHEPCGPFGAKAVAEIPINGPAIAVANAIANACGVRLRHCPFHPETLLTELDRLQATGAGT